MLKSNVTKYLSLSLLLCTAIYSTTFISSPLAEIKNKEANNIIDTKITDNISDRNNTIKSPFGSFKVSLLYIYSASKIVGKTDIINNSIFIYFHHYKFNIKICMQHKKR